MPSEPPVWLFTGPEIGERNTAIDQLKTSAAKQCGNLDLHTLYALDVRMGEVVSLLQNGSLFADARFVVLRNAEVIKKKEDIEALSSWAAASSGVNDAFLVLVSDEIGIDKKIEGIVAKDRKRIFWEMFENRKEQWIADFFRKEGYGIEGEAVQTILEMVENNTDALKTACSRFTLFFPVGHRISGEDAENILAHTREESAFSLFDAMASGDLAASLEILRKLSLSKDSAPVQTIAGLTYCFRRLADWHVLAQTGQMDEFSLKKAGFSGKRAIEQYRAASRRWDRAAADRIVALLASTDLAIRSGGSAIQDCQMEVCLYSILARGGRECAVAEYG
jgi:DNA polymerase-3 subunit delta